MRKIKRELVLNYRLELWRRNRNKEYGRNLVMIKLSNVLCPILHTDTILVCIETGGELFDVGTLEEGWRSDLKYDCDPEETW